MTVSVDNVGPVDHGERSIQTCRMGLARMGAARMAYLPEVDSRGIDVNQTECSPNSPTVWTEEVV